jgi:choline-sulfatase
MVWVGALVDERRSAGDMKTMDGIIDQSARGIVFPPDVTNRNMSSAGATGRRRFLRNALLSATGAGLSVAISPSYGVPHIRRKRHPNVLYIMTDQQSARMMSRTGNPFLATPALDRVAGEGVMFERAYAANPVCVPSRFSMMTGRMPSCIDSEDNEHHSNRVPDKILKNSLGNVFRNAGYQTIYTGKRHLTGADFENGRENVHAYGFLRHLAPNDVSGRDDSTDASCQFLKSQSGNKDPFFLCVSLVNPHDICYLPLNDKAAATGEEPQFFSANANRLIESILKIPEGMSREEYVEHYCPPLPENFEIPEEELPSFTRIKADNYIGWSRRNYTETDWRLYRRLYAGLTEVVDEQIGRVMKAVKEAGLEKDTLIVFTSDHGDQDSSHRSGLKGYLYEESANVPFILKWRGKLAEGDTKRSELVSSGLDLMPTLCDLAEVESPAELPGQSLLPLLSGDRPHNWRTELAIENNRARGLLFNNTWKYMVDADRTNGKRHEMLFNLAIDPGEMHNLAASGDHDHLIRCGRRLLRSWYEGNVETLSDEYA